MNFSQSNIIIDRSSFILENDKKYKNITLFTNRNLNNEISNLKRSFSERNSNFSIVHNSKLNKKIPVMNLNFNKEANKSFLSNSKGTQREVGDSQYSDFKYKVLNNTNTQEGTFKTLIYTKDVNQEDASSRQLEYVPNSFRKNNDSRINSRFFMAENNLNLGRSKSQIAINLLNNKSKDSYVTNKPKIKNSESQGIDNKNDSELIYKKVFSRYKNFQDVVVAKGYYQSLKEAIEKKRKLLKLPTKPDYIHEKIKEIRSKLSFIKGVYDYSYPIVMITKLKTQKKIYEQYIEQFNKKNMKRQESESPYYSRNNFSNK